MESETFRAFFYVCVITMILFIFNSRIPEPANIEFYGKYSSDEDFSKIIRFDDTMAGARKEP